MHFVYDDQLDFQDDKDFTRVRNEIVNSVMNKLEELHRGIGKPGITRFKCHFNDHLFQQGS